MDDWDIADLWGWDEEEDEDEDYEGDYEDLLYEAAYNLSERFFLSDREYLPDAGEDYNLGYLEADDWLPLVYQLDEMVDLVRIVRLAEKLDDLLALPGVPTELLEDPIVFLESVLLGNLPPEASGKRVGSRKLIKIALEVVRVLDQFPEAARAAVRAWAEVHRSLMESLEPGDEESDLADLLFAPDLPPAMTGFSMMIALTLMRWPDRAEGLPLPDEFTDAELYDEVLVQWEALPDSPTITGEGTGEAEALFAQGQLAHMLAQMGAVEVMSPEGLRDEEVALAYSRLSRAILWVHNQCRHCPERDEMGCNVATDWPQRPVPLLDVASEIANTGRVAGCIQA
jgi:hypothetical protein